MSFAAKEAASSRRTRRRKRELAPNDDYGVEFETDNDGQEDTSTPIASVDRKSDHVFVVKGMDGGKKRTSFDDPSKRGSNEEGFSNDDSVAFREFESGSGRPSSANYDPEQTMVPGRKNRRFSWIQIKPVRHDVHSGYVKCSGSNSQGNSDSEVTRIQIQREFKKKFFHFVCLSSATHFMIRTVLIEPGDGTRCENNSC